MFCFVFAALVVNDTSAMKLREKLYLLALGYYRSGDFSRSRDCIQRCLEVEPEWGQAQTLKKAIEDRIVKGNHMVLLCHLSSSSIKILSCFLSTLF